MMFLLHIAPFLALLLAPGIADMPVQRRKLGDQLRRTRLLLPGLTGYVVQTMWGLAAADSLEALAERRTHIVVCFGSVC